MKFCAHGANPFMLGIVSMRYLYCVVEFSRLTICQNCIRLGEVISRRRSVWI